MVLLDLPPETDFEQVKYALVSHPDVIKLLANMANSMGFAWAGGCKDEAVGGPDWDIHRESDGSYTVQFRYDESQPFHDGYWGNSRLKMKLHDFSLRIAPEDFNWNNAQATDITPAIVGSYIFQNNDATTPLRSEVNYTYSLSQSTSHSESHKWGNSVSVSVHHDIVVPFGVNTGVTVTNTVSFEKSWTDTTTTSVTNTSSGSVNVEVPPNTKRLVTVYGAATKMSVDYDAIATVAFKVDFENFLSWSYNAHDPYRDDRPHFNTTLGTGAMSGIDQYLDWWDHRNIPGYSEWDFNKIHDKFGAGFRDYVANSAVKVKLRGTFTNVAGVMANLDVQAAVPLDHRLPHTPPDSEMIKLVTVKAINSDKGGGDPAAASLVRRALPPEGAELAPLAADGVVAAAVAMAAASAEPPVIMLNA